MKKADVIITSKYKLVKLFNVYELFVKRVTNGHCRWIYLHNQFGYKLAMNLITDNVSVISIHKSINRKEWIAKDYQKVRALLLSTASLRYGGNIMAINRNWVY